MNTSHDSLGTDTTESNFSDIEHLSVERKTRDVTDYQGTFDGIRDVIKYQTERKGVDYWSAMEETWQNFVTEVHADDPEMSQFAAVLLRGPYDKAAENRKADLVSRRSTLTREEWDEEAMIKVGLVESNHALRSFLTEQRDDFEVKPINSMDDGAFRR